MKEQFLIYFCNDFDSVYDSQVLDLLKTVNEKNVFKKIILFQGIRNKSQVNKFIEKKLPKEIGIVFFKSYPNYPFYNFLVRKEISRALKSSPLNLEESLFHTRGELLAWHLISIIDKKYHKNILPDIRGTIVEEITEFGNLFFILKYLKIWNYKKAIKSVSELNKITVVSETLKKHLMNSHKINSNNILVTSCLAGRSFNYNVNQRLEFRKELNLDKDDILIIFSSGSSSLWQNNRVLILLADKDMKILNLSKKEVHHNNIINKFVEYCDVPLYLNAADVAIIWREKSIVNQVASPVKFSEYICSGLPVIANDTVDMISEYIINTQYGLLINNIDDIDRAKINKLISLNRQEIADNGFTCFGAENISRKYIQIYSSLLDN